MLKIEGMKELWLLKRIEKNWIENMSNK